MSKPSVLARLLAHVHALLPEDWFGRAGKRFSGTTDAISEFAHEHQVRPADLAHEGVELARTALHGKANKDLAAAVKDFAEAERTKIDAELQRRSLESRIRKEEAEAALAELRVVHSEADLLKKMKELGVVIYKDDSGHLTVLPAAATVDLATLAEQRMQKAVIKTERVVLGAILLDNSAFLQVEQVLSSGDFSIESHQLIYASMRELSSIGRDIDFVNLVENLGAHKNIENAGGIHYITELTDDLPRIKNIKRHVEFLLENKGAFGGSAGSGQ
jgi:hypothetical protein